MRAPLLLRRLRCAVRDSHQWMHGDLPTGWHVAACTRCWTGHLVEQAELIARSAQSAVSRESEPFFELAWRALGLVGWSTVDRVSPSELTETLAGLGAAELREVATAVAVIAGPHVPDAVLGLIGERLVAMERGA